MDGNVEVYECTNSHINLIHSLEELDKLPSPKVKYSPAMAFESDVSVATLFVY